VDEAKLWKITGALSGIIAGALTRRLLVALWSRTTGSEPPANPAAPGTHWREALVWAGASGVALAVTRLVAQRGAAGVWKAATGSYPEGLEEVRA
jgi:hypothetical protein